MKKILFLLLLTIVLGSCDSDTDSSWNNRPGSGETQNWDTYTISIKKSDWKLVSSTNEDNPYYRCIVDDKYLDKNIFDNGSVMVYLIQYDGNTPVQTPLPYVMHYEGADTEGKFFWTETFSYDYSVGSFAFYVTYSDFVVTNSPGACEFKVVMHW